MLFYSGRYHLDIVMTARKGMSPSVKSVAYLVLAILFVAFLYAGFQGWITEAVDSFLGSITYPKP